MITAIYDTSAIFAREFVARRGILWAAVAATLLVVILPIVPGMSDFEPTDIWVAASFGVAIGAAFALSLGLGITLFGHDLSEQRLGFYFERPASSTTIWLGRFLAVYVLIVTFELVTLLPGIVNSFYLLVGDPPEEALLFIAAPAFLLLLSHCVSIMFRARTAWLLVDLVGVTATAWGVWFTIVPLEAQGFDQATTIVGVAFGSGAFLALLTATAVGIAQGRTDLRRTHKYLSLTLWIILPMTVGAVTAYSGWLQSFGPQEFTTFSVGGSSLEGPWVEVQGGADGHLDVRRRFLVSAGGTPPVALPAVEESWTGIRVSAGISDDGSRAVWDDGADSGPATLWTADLREITPSAIETTITLPERYSVGIAPDGTSVGVLNKEDRTFSVFDLQDERLLTVCRLGDEPQRAHFTYVNPSTIRILEYSYDTSADGSTALTTTFSDLAVEKGAKPALLTSLTNPSPLGFRLNESATYLVWNVPSSNDNEEEPPSPQKIIDTATGAQIKQVEGSFGGFLSEDRFWSISKNDDGATELIVEPVVASGEATRIILESWAWSVFVGSSAAGHVIVATDMGHHRENERHPSPWHRVEIFGLASGVKRTIGKDLTIVNLQEAADMSIDNRSQYLRLLENRSGSPVFFIDKDNTLVAWDDEAGLLVPIFGHEP